VSLGLQLPVYRPNERVAFMHARIITMRDAEKTQEVIEDATLIVEGDQIVAVGPSGSVPVPEGARMIDATGKTLMPGIVDAHAHAAHFGQGVIPQQNWAYYANLAFGITAMHDPSATTEFVFSQAELVQAGEMVGPRVFSTGTILYGADGDFKAVVNSLDDARSHLRRMQSNGAFSVKSYNQPRREQHQQRDLARRGERAEGQPGAQREHGGVTGCDRQPGGRCTGQQQGDDQRHDQWGNASLKGRVVEKVLHRVHSVPDGKGSAGVIAG